MSLHQARCYKNASNADCFSLSGGAAGRPNCALPAPQRPPCGVEGSGLLISRQPPPSNGEIMGLHLYVLSAPHIMGNRCSQRGPSGEGCPQGLARASRNQPVKADLKAQQYCHLLEPSVSCLVFCYTLGLITLTSVAAEQGTLCPMSRVIEEELGACRGGDTGQAPGCWEERRAGSNFWGLRPVQAPWRPHDTSLLRTQALMPSLL